MALNPKIPLVATLCRTAKLTCAAKKFARQAAVDFGVLLHPLSGALFPIEIPLIIPCVSVMSYY
jgi:hypothetical protein